MDNRVELKKIKFNDSLELLQSDQNRRQQNRFNSRSGADNQKPNRKGNNLRINTKIRTFHFTHNKHKLK